MKITNKNYEYMKKIPTKIELTFKDGVKKILPCNSDGTCKFDRSLGEPCAFKYMYD